MSIGGGGDTTQWKCLLPDIHMLFNVCESWSLLTCQLLSLRFML